MSENLNTKENFSWFKKWFSKPNDGSLRLSVVNMIVLTIGIGLFYCPYSLSNVGYLLFIALLIIGYFFNRLSFNNYLFWYMDSKKDNWFDISNFYFGKKVEYLSFFIFNSLLIFAYIINFILSKELVATQLNKLYNINLGQNFSIYYSLFFMFFLFPTVLISNTEKLKFVSLIYIFIIIILIIIIIIESYWYNKINKQFIVYNAINKFDKSYFKTFSIIIFSYFSQYGIFDLWSQLKNNNYRRCKKLINIGLIYQFLIILAISIFGYISLGEFLMVENILERDYNKLIGKDFFMNYLTLIFGILLIFKGILMNTVLISQSLNYLKLDLNLKNKILLGYPSILLSGFFCIFYPDILDFIDIIVSIILSYLGYIIPILGYIKAKKNIKKLDYYQNIFVLFIMIFISSFLILEKIFKL